MDNEIMLEVNTMLSSSKEYLENVEEVKRITRAWQEITDEKFMKPEIKEFRLKILGGKK